MENKVQDQSKKRKSLKIGTQLTITIALLCTIVCIILTITAQRLSHKAISDEMFQTMSREAECISNEVYEITVARQKQVAVMANVDQLRVLPEIDRDDDATVEVVTMLKNSLKGDDDINRFVLINTTGEGITTEYNPVNLAERLYFKQYKEGRSPEPDCIISKTSGKQTVMYSAPIRNADGINIGLLCTGVDAHVFSDIVKSINVGTERPVIIKYDGQFIAHQDADLVMSGANLFETSACGEEFKTMLGDTTMTKVLNDNGIEKIYSFTPIKNTPWYVGISLRTDEALIGYSQLSKLIILICFVLILISITIAIFLGRMISNPITAIIDRLKDMSKGVLEKVELKKNHFSEIEEIYNTTNDVIDGLTKAADFADNIGNGNLNTQFERLSENDSLGTNLLVMRKRLQEAEAESEKRKIEDEKVNWATLGLAKFAEILHTSSQNINDLSYEILRNLIKYIDVNQGAIYVLDDTGEEAVYEMTAAIAYDRRKFLQKRFAVGEDLVGRCAYERKTIYMTDIPKDYIKITSGMGSSTASTLLLVPLVLNDEIFGIIELASFHTLEDYKINFVEKVGESIASTISTVKINERTNNLLNQSKIQAEELASKEEEMRQNMEELQATQEEAARRENESNAIMKVINDKMIVVEYDMSGTITNVNETYAMLLGSTTEQLIGKKSDDGVEMTAEQHAAHIQMWNQLRRGQVVTETNHITLNNRDLWIQETYTPVLDQNENAPYKVMKVGIDVTDRMKADNTISKLEKENADSSAKIIDLENQLKGQPAAAPAKKAVKQAKSEPADTANEFDAEVGEQELIAWDSANETGIIEIDEQLKQLAELANTVYTTFRANKPKKEMKDTLRSLSDFAAYHFGTIEGYADESGFSDAKQMKQSFKDFSAKINDFAKLYADGKVKSADALMLFMNNWMKADFAQMKLLAESLKK